MNQPPLNWPFRSYNGVTTNWTNEPVPYEQSSFAVDTTPVVQPKPAKRLKRVKISTVNYSDALY